MIGGGQLAYTLLGIDVDSETVLISYLLIFNLAKPQDPLVYSNCSPGLSKG